MGKDTDQMRAQIAAIRDQIQETVETISVRAEVQTVTVQAEPGVDDPSSSVEETMRALSDRPVALALSGLIAGFATGMLIPATKVEREMLAHGKQAVAELRLKRA